MSDNVAITPGSGVTIRTSDVGGVQYQYVKLDVGGAGTSLPVTAGGTNYLPVAVASVAGNVTIVPAASQQFPVVNAPATTLAISASAAIPVSAVVAAPVFVRLSDGTNPIATLPVSGTVSANQGTAAAGSGAWPMSLYDQSNHPIKVTNITGSNYALDVNIVKSVSLAGSQADETTFAEGSGLIGVIGATYNDSIGNPTAGQAGAMRMTQLRGLHINIRKNDGTELGIAATPLRVDPTGTTAQPGDITKIAGSSVATSATGVQKVGLSDGTGNAISETHPVLVAPAGQYRTRIMTDVALSASQTAAAVVTPTSGKIVAITKIILTVSVTGTLKFFDDTDGASARLFNGTIPTGIFIFSFEEQPVILTAVNHVLKYTSGTGLTGDVVVHSYEI